MPGEEQDDIVMTSTQGNLLNMKCPLTGLHVFHLGNPVRWYEILFGSVFNFFL